ncbi:sugar phosphate isomerase/epimerase family protein [Paenibacillus sepulcri]|uniref:Sugar phosphate isomerase/epimerase n=1 Tax=Paenibacillus sepulcri TaxID=359917 RepID=A0ABS7C5F0_9BACL|nr:sugar phosphate isomerase/epimerase [Paenibacillus sepulcri]
MRLGGPIFKHEERDPARLVKIHQRLGYSAAYCSYIADGNEREEYKQAFREADIVLAELGAYCINISDPDIARQEKNIAEIMTRLRQAEEMETVCCVMHGGSYNNMGCVMSHKDNFAEANIEHNIRVIQRIIDEVEPRRTKLVLETESYVLPDNPDLYLRMMKEINRDAFAVHLDPVNMTSDPRRVYYNGDFIRECFEKLGPYIVSCHAKDTNLVHHATTQITETYLGNGTLDYDEYLTQLSRLPQEPPLMIEHLSEDELPAALDYIFGKAEQLGLTFKHREKRELFGQTHNTV